MSQELLTGGIVLCGGESKRMGCSKAWLPFAGETMVSRVVRLLGEAVRPVVVVAAPGQDLPPLPGATVVVRDEEKGRGPLQGLAAGLAALEGQVDAAYASSCDVPLLVPAFVRRVVALLGDHAICVPYIAGFHHPLAAVYRLDVLAAVRRLLTEDRLRPFFLVETVRTRVVSADDFADVDSTLQSLRNLNTPADYERALAEVAARELSEKKVHGRAIDRYP